MKTTSRSPIPRAKSLRFPASSHNSRRSPGWKRRRVAREEKLKRLRSDRNPHVVVGVSPDWD